jgi:hypothetical protein
MERFRVVGSSKIAIILGATSLAVATLASCTNAEQSEERLPNGNVESCIGNVRYLGSFAYQFDFSSITNDPNLQEDLDRLLVDFGKGNEIEIIDPANDQFRRPYSLGLYNVTVAGWYNNNQEYRELCNLKILSSPSPGPGNEDKIGQPFYPIGEQSPKCDMITFKQEEGLIDFSALNEQQGENIDSYKYDGKEIPSSLKPTQVKIDPLEPSAPIVFYFENGEWLQCHPL